MRKTEAHGYQTQRGQGTLADGGPFALWGIR